MKKIVSAVAAALLGAQQPIRPRKDNQTNLVESLSKAHPSVRIMPSRRSLYSTPNHTRFTGVAAQKRAARKLRNKKRAKK